MDMLTAAVAAGADAVYLGLEEMNARRTAGNFTPYALKQAVAYCHARNVRVYVALNTLLSRAELPKMILALQHIASANADAVIVQDMAVAVAVKKILPNIALHASTQMSVHSAEGVKQLAKIGFSRVILSRELSCAEIAKINAECNIETEVFVHGALCMCVSGQCYMSAFFGGRSGNKGSCAGPCRLPFDTCANEDKADSAHHLSLKDMSSIHMLKQLKNSGVACVKIEGRLRTPEYAAGAINACRLSLNGEEYDKQLLQDVFSRSGFTDGYINGKLDKEMFGIRTSADSTAEKKALPKLRELYRRERQNVSVSMSYKADMASAQLVVSDEDGNTCTVKSEVLPTPANSDRAEDIKKSLLKTGGTPFSVNGEVNITGGEFYLPASQINSMRKEVLEKLLEKRTAFFEQSINELELKKLQNMIIKEQNTPSADIMQAKKLYVQVSNFEQIPKEWLLADSIELDVSTSDLQKEECNLLHSSEVNGNNHPQNKNYCPDALIVPIEQWNKVPKHMQSKTWLALPRFCALAEQEKIVKQNVKELFFESENNNFAGCFVQNIAHINMCDGIKMLGGFGLNTSNAMSLAALTAMGVDEVTLSVETTCEDIKYCSADIALVKYAENALNLHSSETKTAQTAALIYGYMPLMMTYACPLHNKHTCKECAGTGTLIDRKGEKLNVTCTGKNLAGVRTIYNAVPLYMGDKKHTLNVGAYIAMFTSEKCEKVAQIVEKIRKSEPYDGRYTRGLYFK